MVEHSLETTEMATTVPSGENMFLRLKRSSALRSSMLLLVLAGVWLFFYFATNGTFLTPRNLVLLALQTSIVSLAAISAVMLIVTRNFDLSVGSAVAFVGVILALLTVKHDVNAAVAVLIAISGGVLMGAWQGFWVTRLGVSSFIVTLAGMLYFRGISMIATNGATVAPLPRSLTSFATGFLSPTLSISAVVTVLAAYGTLRVVEIRRAHTLGVSGNITPELFRALTPPLIAAILAIWIASWQGLPYLVLLVAICTFACRIPDAPHAIWCPALRNRRKSRSGAAFRYKSDARHLLELCHCRLGLWYHGRGAHGSRKWGDWRQRRPVP